MAGKKPLLTKTKLKTVSTSVLSTRQKNLSQGSKVLKQLTANAIATDRDKLLFLLLCASASEKAKLASYFFEDLPKRLATVGGRMNLSPKRDFNFANWEAFAEHVKGKVLKMGLRTANVGEFKGGMKGRKWWFMGDILWERYIKYGPVRRFLDKTAEVACRDINTEIINNKSISMTDAWNNSISITSMFGKLSAGVEFLLETENGEKKYLDFGHIAFNKDGYWILPTPTEIKLPWAAGQVAKQFSEFIPRFQSAGKLIVVFEETDLGKLKGSGIMYLKTEIVDGRKLAYAELDRSKLVLDPIARNQMVVKPTTETWGSVNKPTKSPTIDIGVGATTQGGGFNFWKIQVDVSRTPFEQLYEAIFLGKK